MTYESFFRTFSLHDKPHDWQSRLAEDEQCVNRLIKIPTGFGKTAGVLGTWIYHRLLRNDPRWPNRLVWCLPMRVLVEQTAGEARTALERLGCLWDEKSDHHGKVGVHLLMGGADAGEWHLFPEHCAVLIGTQDLLLSRAVNRGYASPRARWPMEFGLLNQDCLWVMDEVQLMDTGLATSAQLQAFRDDEGEKNERRCHTWWMSATLQAGWLSKSPDTNSLMANLPSPSAIDSDGRKGHLWDDVRKPCSLQEVKDVKALATVVKEAHIQGRHGASGPTLVVVNTVERAVEVYEGLRKFAGKDLGSTDLRLVHSRFRPEERSSWRTTFLNKDACAPGIDRIIVATQVVEAGVDISAGILITELAPWASLVQRFGRSARWGGTAQVIVADLGFKDDKALPYTDAELDAARDALGLLNGDVSPLHLEMLEERHPEMLARLFPFDPQHLLLRHELDELFDTSPDLSGADIDISRFIRSGEERDLHVFWADIEEKGEPSSEVKPSRDALCPVPFLKARNWLCGKERGKNKLPRLKQGMRAWIWDWQDGVWRVSERRDLYPGQTVLVDAHCGGYDFDAARQTGRGWDPDHKEPVEPIRLEVLQSMTKRCWTLNTDGDLVVSEKSVKGLPAGEVADGLQDSEGLSVTEHWKTIATHGRETGREARRIVQGLVPRLTDLFDLAGRWHDTGKAHPAFQSSIQYESVRPERQDLAKAPDAAWPCSPKRLYEISPTDRRPGFRHELASVLALFGVLQRHAPDHPALLGPWRELLSKIGAQSFPSRLCEDGNDETPTPLEREILSLDADRFDLLTYLVCAHHGKLRVAWHASKGDQASNDGMLRIRGVREGDILPPVVLPAADGSLHELKASLLDLSPAAAGLSPRTGASWTERVLGLLARYGPFTLAWLEALLRAADQRASRNTVADPLLEADNAPHELERSNSDLADPASGGTPAQAPSGDSQPRGTFHGDGGGAGGRSLHSGTTRPPRSATRYVETQLGIVSYQQLAPHLAERVALTELAVSERQFAAHPFDETLLLTLHTRICADLIPEIAGRWRTREVQVGEHQAPAAWRVPLLMREYTADLSERIAHAPKQPDEGVIEILTFAEGRLLHIHPFEDFNGRVTRLFLVELLYRLDLPIVDPATDPGANTQHYFAALRSYDRRDSRPLAQFWRDRFEKGGRQ